jgi:MFS family permease
MGNGLVSSTLIVYLVQSLGASGLGVGLILAAPQLIGLGRLGAARFSRGGTSRRRFCIGNYFASGLVLAALPALAVNHQRLLPKAALAGVVAVWCLYHLLEYLATVALWAWLRDLVPLAHRGLFIGRRERWLNAGRVIGMLGGGLFAWQCGQSADWKWAAYVVPAAAGAVFLMAAVIPLLAMPIGSTAPASGAEDAGSGQPSSFRWRQLLTPLVDPRLSRLMIYGCWFSFFNGLTQSAQGVFPVRVLDLQLIWLLGFRTAMTCGQTLVSPQVGRWADRFGNRPVLMVSQAIVALGLWGYMQADAERWWLIGLAWFAWIAYAGINIGVPNLLLKLSPPGQAGACVASYFALTGICYGVSTIVGGLAFDHLQGQTIFVRNSPLDRYEFMFLFGIITRSTGIVFLLAVDEPPTVASEAEVGVEKKAVI